MRESIKMIGAVLISCLLGMALGLLIGLHIKIYLLGS